MLHTYLLLMKGAGLPGGWWWEKMKWRLRAWWAIGVEVLIPAIFQLGTSSTPVFFFCKAVLRFMAQFIRPWYLGKRQMLLFCSSVVELANICSHSWHWLQCPRHYGADCRWYENQIEIRIIFILFFANWACPVFVSLDFSSLLASGSDDQHTIVWDPLNHKKLLSMHTGHTANIFSVKVSECQAR